MHFLLPPVFFNAKSQRFSLGNHWLIILYGAPSKARTCGLLLRRQGGTTQKSPQTLGETDPAENVVTQNVTKNTKNVTREALLEALRGIPREDLLGLLSELLKP